VLIVTHDDRIFKFADVIHSMSDGRIVGSVDGKSRDETVLPPLQTAFAPARRK
jgi:ABC-type siderophore export system fused ATPase/permease subunit